MSVIYVLQYAVRLNMKYKITIEARAKSKGLTPAGWIRELVLRELSMSDPE